MRRLKGTSTNRKKKRQSNAKRSPKKSRVPRPILMEGPVKQGAALNVGKFAVGLQVPASAHIADLSLPLRDHVFSFHVDSIGGETTIGDLIVAFPRTRDVLMKHGLRFDVEDAGYLYMTLNVFSAMHGLVSHSLIQEVHATAKEQVPLPIQPIRSVPAVPSP